MRRKHKFTTSRTTAVPFTRSGMTDEASKRMKHAFHKVSHMWPRNMTTRILYVAKPHYQEAKLEALAIERYREEYGMGEILVEFQMPSRGRFAPCMEMSRSWHRIAEESHQIIKTLDSKQYRAKISSPHPHDSPTEFLTITATISGRKIIHHYTPGPSTTRPRETPVYYSTQTQQQKKCPQRLFLFVPPNPSHVNHIWTTPMERERSMQRKYNYYHTDNQSARNTKREDYHR